VLGFGGQVMKNVAGYDVSRLLAGSLGTLGLIAEASLKVLPRPLCELTLSFEMPEERAIEALNRWPASPLPISRERVARRRAAFAPLGRGTCRAGRGRKNGGRKNANRKRSGPPFASRPRRSFGGPEPLWRIAVPPRTARWASPEDSSSNGRRLALAQVRRFGSYRARGGAARQGPRHAVPRRRQAGGGFCAARPVLMRLHRELKAAFDPAGIFNPGRLYAEM